MAAAQQAAFKNKKVQRIMLGLRFVPQVLAEVNTGNC